MAVKFQSQEWAEQVSQALSSNEQVLNAAKGQNVTLQVVTTDVPGGGENKFYWRVTDGKPEVALGEAENPEATITVSYENAVAIDKGELNAQQAFMQGKLKIGGNLMKVMQMQGFMQSLGPAMAGIDREY